MADQYNSDTSEQACLDCCFPLSDDKQQSILPRQELGADTWKLIVVIETTKSANTNKTMKAIKAKGARLNKLAAKLVSSLVPVVLVFLGPGCSTMKMTPLTTGRADSYAQHEQKNGVVVGIRPMTGKREIKDMFKVNLLDKGVLPILVVAENQSASASFIIAKDKVSILNEATGTTSSSQRKKVTSGSGEALAITGGILVATGSLVAAPLLFTGMQKASNATVIEFNLADKEFYSWTLGPGEKAQGFVYFQFPKGSPPSGNYHVVAEVKNPASGEATSFDFPVNLTLPK